MNKKKTTEAAPTRRESPFTQCIEKDEYFTGFGHLNVFASVRRDIDAAVPIIVLTGEGGCGKSVLGKMLMSETIPGCISIHFRKPIDSFEDVVGVMASRAEAVVPDTSRAGIAMAIEDIAASAAQRKVRFLLICDGAEQIYLATLERIRRMLDSFNRSGVLMQMILIGRPVLLDNLKQLRLCNFEEVPERKYVLEPLSLAETTSYLEFSKKRMSEEDARLFTPEVVNRIYRASAGNIKKINSLAEDIFTKSGKEASFWTLLDTVEGGMSTASGWEQYKRRLMLLIQRKPPLRAGLIGGAIVGLGLLLFVFTEGEQTSSEPAENTVAQSQAGAVQAVQDKADAAASAAAHAETPDYSAKDGLPAEMAAPEGAEQEVLAARPPEQTAGVPSQEVGAEGGKFPSASAEEPIAGDGGSQTQEPVALAEDRQRVASLLAEAQEVVDAAGRPADDNSASRQNAPAVPTAGENGTGREMTAPTGEEGANIELAAGKAGDSAEAVAPAPPVLRPAKVKKVVLTKPQAAHPDSRQDSPGSAALLSAEESSSKVPRLRSEVGKKKIQPESAAAAAAVNAVEQAPSLGIPQYNRGDRGLQLEQSQNLQAGISGGPAKIAAVQSESKKIPVLGQAIVPQKVSSATNAVDQPGSPIRVDAAPSWLAGARDSKYTLQLMALSSAAAVDNVNQMLTGNASGRPAGTFYVFEKRGTPPEIFVFYGEYDSVAEAGKARDSLPEPLRRHKPYVLSVKSAMQKVK